MLTKLLCGDFIVASKQRLFFLCGWHIPLPSVCIREEEPVLAFLAPQSSRQPCFWAGPADPQRWGHSTLLMDQTQEMGFVAGAVLPKGGSCLGMQPVGLSASSTVVAEPRGRLVLMGAGAWGRAAGASQSPHRGQPTKWLGNSLATAAFPSPGSFLIELLLDHLIFI